MDWERFEQMVQDRHGNLQEQASRVGARSIEYGAEVDVEEDRFGSAQQGWAMQEEADTESRSISTGAGSIKQEYNVGTAATQPQDAEGRGSSATGSANCGDGDGDDGDGGGGGEEKLVGYENVENFYLYNGTSTVSITRLRICIGDDVMAVEEGEEVQEEAYLIGQTPGESKEVRVLVESWKIDLRSDSAPAFFLKSNGRWIQVQKPKLAYRHVMNDGLTLAHFLHFVIRHPTASAESAREHLAQYFGQFGEQPSIKELSLFTPVIKRQVKTYMDLEKATVLRAVFPHQFNNLKTSFNQRFDKMSEAWEGEREPLRQNSFDMTGEIFDEIQDKEQNSIGSNGISKPKSQKQRRLSVQADLRILNTQWRNLINGGTKVNDREKRPEHRKINVQISRRKSSNSVQKSSVPPEFQNDSLEPKPIAKGKLGRKPKPGSKPKIIPQPTHSWEEKVLHQLQSHSSEPDSLEFCKSSPTKKRKKDPLGMFKNVKEEEEDVVVCPNFRPKSLELKPTKRNFVDQTSSGSGSGSASYGGSGKRMTRVRPPATERQNRVHSPSRSNFLEGLEEPPICDICDDGGDLLCCDGPCRRHFHAMPDDGSGCKTLGLTLEQTMTPEYFCQNCLLERHQCFICQDLGSSSSSLVGPQEVYMCDALGCQKYYHAECVAKVLYPGRDATALAERIQRGLHGFLCPRHFCAVCVEREVTNGIFVQCRRCPNAWHRECLTDFEASGQLPTISIWRHDKREFTYCKEHKIIEQLQTPAQDHIKFPGCSRSSHSFSTTGMKTVGEAETESSIRGLSAEHC